MNEPEKKIDDAVEKILNVAGSSLRNYEPRNRDKLRAAMREIMSASYIAGSNACAEIAGAAGKPEGGTHGNAE